MMRLRPYQHEAIDAVYQHLRRRDDNPCVVIPTAGGKTPILATLCRDAVERWNGRVLVVSHVKELLAQAIDKLKSIAPELSVGVYSAGLKKRDTEHSVIVAGIQSIYKRACELDSFDLIIVDECLVAGTLVATPTGEIPIEQVQPGMYVRHAFGVDRVIGVSARSANELVSLEFTDGTSITCTSNHPVFTEQGWVQAGAVELGSVAYSVEDLLMLRKRVSALDKDAGRWSIDSPEGIALQEAAVLFNLLFEDPRQLHAVPEGSRKSESYNESDWSRPEGSGRQRSVDETATTASRISGRGVDSRVCRNSRRGNAFGTTECSEDRPCQSNADDCDRTRWPQPLCAGSTNSGLQEELVFGSKRVARVTHHEPQSERTVFNLHVAGHPSYFANGTLVHNCHLIPTEGDGMYRQFLADAKVVSPHVRVVGLTATAFRLDSGPICSDDHFLNSICYEIGIRELIRDGYLCPPNSKSGKAKADTSGLHIRGGEFIAGEVEDLMDQEALVEAACEEIVERTRDRNAVLIFAAGVQHGRNVVEELEVKHDIECGFVCGDTPNGERDELLARFRGETSDGLFERKPLKFLCNVNVLTTGFDAPNIDCVVLLRPTASPGLYYQMVGRGFRLHPDKHDCLVLDYGGNVVRHGPVDQIEVKPKSNGGGEAPAKECPECDSIVAAGYANCPDCGFEFPPPERGKHETKASEEGVLSGQVSLTKYAVTDVFYSVHTKRDADEDAPKTMRVDYQIGWNQFQSEWICFEHSGYARQKAYAWWSERSPDAFPNSAQRAVEIAQAGGIADCLEITVRSVSGEKFDRIVDYALGEIPEAIEVPLSASFDPEDIPF